MHPRTPDFLHRHENVARRVRNLETGVHPVSLEGEWWLSIPYTVMTDESALLTHWNSGGSTFRPAYEKRSGNVMLSGSIQGPLSSIGVDGDKYSTLPLAARPARALNIIAPVAVVGGAGNGTVSQVRVEIGTDGELRVFNEFGIVGDTNSRVYLDGIVYSAG